MKKAKVKLDLKGLSIPKKIAMARQVVTSLTNNPNFTSPSPSLAEMTVFINDLETAYTETQAARLAAQAKTSTQSEKEQELDKRLSRLGLYIEHASNGDQAIIQNVGLNVRSEAGKIGELSAPTDLSATAGDKDGEIDLQWDRVYGARSYIIEYCQDPISVSGWKSGFASTKSKIAITALTSGQKYWFRVAALGTAGQSAWSDPATRYAP